MKEKVNIEIYSMTDSQKISFAKNLVNSFNVEFINVISDNKSVSKDNFILFKKMVSIENSLFNAKTRKNIENLTVMLNDVVEFVVDSDVNKKFKVNLTSVSNLFIKSGGRTIEQIRQQIV